MTREVASSTGTQLNLACATTVSKSITNEMPSTLHLLATFTGVHYTLSSLVEVAIPPQTGGELVLISLVSAEAES